MRIGNYGEEETDIDNINFLVLYYDSSYCKDDNNGVCIIKVWEEFDK